MLRMLVFLCLVAGMPLVGAALAGRPLVQYTEFPPTTRYIEQPSFSWPVFIAMAAGILIAVMPFVLRVLTRLLAANRVPAPGPTQLTPGTFRFPAWGWVGVLITAVSWFFAWTRFEWFAPLQPFTFSPLWLGYILVVNGIEFRRSGQCLMTGRPRHFLSLFPLSAAFWWCFEYLNRFVQNWYYSGVEGFTPLQYFIFATLPFATVLPAVLSTASCLRTFPAAGSGLDHVMLLNTRGRWLPVSALLVASCGLAGIGWRPDLFYPLLWLAPLFILTSLQALGGRPTIFTPVRYGYWQRICLMAAAALVCGFFWEMWNYLSVAQWKYAVPYVQAFHVFEMPLLGYAGYLPFGLECAVVAEMLDAER
jgi:hypothetical protein